MYQMKKTNIRKIILNVFTGSQTFVCQPELSQSESYMQGPSPSTHGFVEEHLEMGSHCRGALRNMATMKASFKGS